MTCTFTANAPDQYLREHIAINRAQIPFFMQRRFASDRKIAFGARHSVRWAIRIIREYSAELERRGLA